MTSSYARVGVGEPLGPLDYSIPEPLRDSIAVGAVVRVPLGQRRVVGIVLSLLAKPADELEANQIKDLFDLSLIHI